MRKKFVSLKMHYHAVDQRNKWKEERKEHIKKKKSQRKKGTIYSLPLPETYTTMKQAICFSYITVENNFPKIIKRSMLPNLSNHFKMCKFQNGLLQFREKTNSRCVIYSNCIAPNFVSFLSV